MLISDTLINNLLEQLCVIHIWLTFWITCTNPGLIIQTLLIFNMSHCNSIYICLTQNNKIVIMLTHRDYL